MSGPLRKISLNNFELTYWPEKQTATGKFPPMWNFGKSFKTPDGYRFEGVRLTQKNAEALFKMGPEGLKTFLAAWQQQLDEAPQPVAPVQSGMPAMSKPDEW